jgi:hypothetical protein
MKIITRSDFDGLVCAVLLKEVLDIDEIEFVHPKDVQDGKIKVTSDHILCNLPFVKGVGLWFDHHSSEAIRINPNLEYEGKCEIGPSAARVIYNYFKNEKKTDKLDRILNILIHVDKYDSAQLSRHEVIYPSGWILIAFVTDPRTGLAYSHDYVISNLQLMMNMIEMIRTKTFEELLAHPDIKARVDRYFSLQDQFEVMLSKHSKQIENLVLTDLRGVEPLPGNRFSIYFLYPQTNVSIRIFDGKKGENVVISGGYSIFNKTASVDLGELFARFGGGGHKATGTCQIPVEKADEVIASIVGTIVLYKD